VVQYFLMKTENTQSTQLPRNLSVLCEVIWQKRGLFTSSHDHMLSSSTILSTIDSVIELHARIYGFDLSM